MVAVGSKNPVKLEAVRRAFSLAFETHTIQIVPYDVPSGVSAQPWGDSETREGALNRAHAACISHLRASGFTPDYAVGLEGGVEDDLVASRHRSSPVKCLPHHETQCFAWFVILHGEGTEQKIGMARSATVTLPHRVVALMKGDPPMELGEADDLVFNEVNSKHKGGTVVKLTAGLIDRTEYYVHALKLALAPFLHDQTGLYDVPEPPPKAQWWSDLCYTHQTKAITLVCSHIIPGAAICLLTLLALKGVGRSIRVV